MKSPVAGRSLGKISERGRDADVKIAKLRQVCRVCDGPIDKPAPNGCRNVTYAYGREFAHSYCLEQERAPFG